MELKILHTADIHIGDFTGPVKFGKNMRRIDTLNCIKKIVDTAKLERPNISIIAGDLFHKSKCWIDSGIDDINDIVNELLRPLCNVSDEVVLVMGTDSHDGQKSFELLQNTIANEFSNIHIYIKPGLYNLNTSIGSVQILAVPSFDKSRYKLFGFEHEQNSENINPTKYINNLIMDVSSKINRSVLSIMTAHMAVYGSALVSEQEAVLLTKTMENTGVNLICLGHIHKPQRLRCSIPAYYSGCINQVNFGDEGIEHGFYIHSIDVISNEVKSRFIKTPERKHVTIYFDDSEIDYFLNYGNINNISQNIKDAIVRIKYTCSHESSKALNKSALQKYIIECGAFYVSGILFDSFKEHIPNIVSYQFKTPYDAFDYYIRNLNLCESDILRIKDLASSLMKQFVNNNYVQSGVFMPSSIKVENYRSYKKAEFDFSSINMAIVNGNNGSGKSSLFIDAIADCLFEKSRDDSVGGWLRNGESKGSITFEFYMDTNMYRVTRTRTKSGKGTATLEYLNKDFRWENIGQSSIKAVQSKIEQILGMDCDTFCSVALIRQNAYGVFLEAGSTRRMEVLSSLLNIDIYSELEDLAKSTIREQKRKVSYIKEKISQLDDIIYKKSELQKSKIEAEHNSNDMKKELDYINYAIESAQREQTIIEEMKRQAEIKQNDIKRIYNTIDEKRDILDNITKRYEILIEKASFLEQAESAYNEVENARNELDKLSSKEEALRKLIDKKEDLSNDIKNKKQEVYKLNEQKKALCNILKRKSEVEVAKIEIEKLKNTRYESNKKIALWNRALEKYNEAKYNKDTFLSESRIRINRLKSQIDECQKKVDILSESGCPFPEKASCEFLKDAFEAKEDLKELQNKLSKIKNDYRRKYENLLDVFNKSKLEIDSIKNPYDDINDIEKREKDISHLIELSPEIDAAEFKNNDITNRLSDIEKQIDTIESDLVSIDIDIQKLQKYHYDAKKAREVIKQKQSDAKMFVECKAAKAEASALNEQTYSLKKEIESLNLTLYEHEHNKIEQPIETERIDIEQLNKKRHDILENMKNSATKYGGIISELENISFAENDREKLLIDIKKESTLLSDYEILLKAFEPEGIRYIIIKEVIPEINIKTNSILNSMIGGNMSVDIRTERVQKSNKKVLNSIDVWIKDAVGGFRPYQSYSGGEKVKISLAVTLALADIKAKRAGVQLGMLFIDEPPFLDSEGYEAYADALFNMSFKNPDMRIIAISHDITMKSRFKQNIFVENSYDGSKVIIDN